MPGAISLYSNRTGAIPANGACVAPAVSSDGAHIAFLNNSSDLFPGILAGQIYSKAAATGLTALVSANLQGVPGNSPSTLPLFMPGGAAAGRSISFVSYATNLVPGAGGPGQNEIFLKTLENGAITAIASDSNNSPVNATLPNQYVFMSSPISMLADARAAFTAMSAALIPGVPGTQVYVKSIPSRTLLLASSDSQGTPADGQPMHPVISEMGRHVAFRGPRLVPAHTQPGHQTYVKNLFTKEIALVSSAADGTPSNGQATGTSIMMWVSISADGSKVAFTDNGTNLVPGQTSPTWNIYVKDTSTGGVTLVTSGNLTGGMNINPTISGDGRYVAFHSSVTPPTGSGYSIYIRDLQTGALDWVGYGANNYENISMSPNGEVVTFGSTAANMFGHFPLVPAGVQQVYRWRRTGISSSAAGAEAPSMEAVPATSPAA